MPHPFEADHPAVFSQWMTNPAIALESTETIVCFHVGSEQFQVLPENNIDISKF